MKVEKLKIFGGIKVKKGALHKQLGYPLDKKIGKTVINRLAKIEIGKSFTLNGKKRKMTGLMKKRVGLARAFQGMKK